MTIQVKDNDPKEEDREEATIMMEVEDDVQVFVPPIEIQSPVLQLTDRTPPLIRTTPESPSNHYDRFKTKKSHPSIITPLK